MIYDVTVTRDSGMWAVVIGGLPPHVTGATDVERFADLALEVRDLIAGLTETEPDSLDLRWRYVIDGQDVTHIFEALKDSEHELGKASAIRDAARRNVICALSGMRLSQSAIGDVIGLSHQRVNQLLKS